MTSPIEKTLALLDLEKIDKNVFSWQGENFGWHRICLLYTSDAADE